MVTIDGFGGIHTSVTIMLMLRPVLGASADVFFVAL
jgi:hypothetical protein